MTNTSDDFNNNSKKIISIIGCGLIGQAWAVVFLRAGFNVKIYDKKRKITEHAKLGIEDKIKELGSFGLVNQHLIAEMMLNLTLENGLEDALRGSCYVQECGPEDLEIKSKLTAAIDEYTDEGVPIGSSTSGIPASSYAAEAKGRNRCLVVHPINPPHLIPAVEIVPSQWTDKSVLETASKIMFASGQTPIVLEKEIEGFILNRLQGALLTEAFQLLADGVASYEDIDKAVTDGLGFRWSLMGPFESIHLNAPLGVAQYIERYGPMYRKMFSNTGDKTDWSLALEKGLEESLVKKHPISNLDKSCKDRDQKMMLSLVQKQKGRLN